MIQVGNICVCRLGELGLVTRIRNNIYSGFKIEDHTGMDDNYQFCITNRNWSSEYPELIAESMEELISGQK